MKVSPLMSRDNDYTLCHLLMRSDRRHVAVRHNIPVEEELLSHHGEHNDISGHVTEVTLPFHPRVCHLDGWGQSRTLLPRLPRGAKELDQGCLGHFVQSRVKIVHPVQGLLQIR